MTIGIGDRPSLLDALIRETRDGAPSARPGSGSPSPFEEGLSRLLASSAADSAPAGEAARGIAQALSLQMLHTTLSLAGDDPAPVAGSGALLQELARSYGANARSAPPSAAPAHQELPEAEPATPPAVSPAAAEGPHRQGESWLDPVVARASRRYGVEVGLIKAVIKAESGFNPAAVSHAGARGLMQLMPSTARSLGVNDSFDPEQNVMAGTRFLRDLLDRYNGDVDSALAAYNWGPGNVDRRPERLPRETRDYLARVKQFYRSYTS